nr:hypothetical protein Q903MT_gene5168 [Picea sitchensis]
MGVISSRDSCPRVLIYGLVIPTSYFYFSQPWYNYLLLVQGKVAYPCLRRTNSRTGTTIPVTTTKYPCLRRTNYRTRLGTKEGNTAR